MNGNVSMSRTQDQISQTRSPIFVDVDVGKARLDVFLHPAGLRFEVENNRRGIARLLRRLARHEVALVSLEATSTYRCLAHEMLHESGVPITVVNPFRSRQFADSVGKLAKTDRIDAAVLARFAELMRPEPSVPLSEQH